MDLFSLIRTKLSPPRIGSAQLQRNALLTLMEEAPRLLTLILGPAGSGKTTLAALWRKRLVARSIDVAWYNIGADDDENQCAAYVIAALQQAGLDIDDAMAQLMLREAAESDQRFITVLVNKLFAHPRPVCLFLDDLHLLRGTRFIGVLQGLLSNSPPHLHIVVTSRSLPHLKLDLLQAKGQVQEINFSLLRFSLKEQIAFFEDLGINGLSSTQAKKLYALTEGWVAGVQLAAWSMKKGADFEATYARMIQRAIPLEQEGAVAYFEDTIASIMEPYQLELLIRMSACRRITHDLANIICQDARAGKLLEALGAHCFFLMQIESEDQQVWFRFHRIFASFLRERLNRLPSGELIEINRRASLWFENNNLYVEAIRHAGYAGDMPRQIDLLTVAARALICAGQFIQLLRWSAEMPVHALQERIQLLLCIGWSQLCSRRLGDFETTLAAIERHGESSEPIVDFEVRLLRALYHIARDDSERAFSLIEPFIDSPPSADGFNLVMLGIAAGNSLINRNEFGRSRDVVSCFQALLRQRHGPRVRPYLESLVGLSFIAQGDFLQARGVLGSLMNSLASEGNGAEFSTAHIAGYLAEVSWHLGDVETAQEYHDIYTEQADLLGSRDCTLCGLRTRARLHFGHGDLPRALQALDELESLAQDEGWDRLAAWSLAERVRMLGKQVAGMTAMREALRRLSRLASRYPLDVPGAHGEIHIAAEIAEVDAAIAELQWQHVFELAMPLSSKLVNAGRMALGIRMRILAAIAKYKLKETVEALEISKPTLVFAMYHGMNRLFVDEGDYGLELASELLNRLELTTDERRYLCRNDLPKKACDIVSSPQATASKRTTDEARDVLSPREKEIVTLLSRALSGKTIARALNVSPGTIKWHTKNIYSKLGAISREDAVAKARELQLID